MLQLHIESSGAFALDLQARCRVFARGPFSGCVFNSRIVSFSGSEAVSSTTPPSCWMLLRCMAARARDVCEERSRSVLARVRQPPGVLTEDQFLNWVAAPKRYGSRCGQLARLFRTVIGPFS